MIATVSTADAVGSNRPACATSARTAIVAAAEIRIGVRSDKLRSRRRDSVNGSVRGLPSIISPATPMAATPSTIAASPPTANHAAAA